MTANNLQSNIGQFVKPTDPYEKGFIDGMQKQMQSKVQQMVERYAQLRELTVEEIYKIANSIEIIQPQHGLKLSNDLNVIEFARLIRKSE